jgi:hypothetical protein
MTHSEMCGNVLILMKFDRLLGPVLGHSSLRTAWRSARRFKFANWRVCMIQCAGSQKSRSATALEEPRSSGGVAADHEPRTPAGQFFQLEAPQGVDVEARPRPRGVEGASAAQVYRRSQPQKALRFERRDLEPSAAAVTYR